MRLLVDPMLDPAGARPAVPGTPNDRTNPLVDLPEPAERIVTGVDAVLVTHLHTDHLDEQAVALLGNEIPVLCQPHDAAELGRRGFSDVRPVTGEAEVGHVKIVLTPGRHGHDELADELGPVSGFVISAEREPPLYIAGDTVFCPAVQNVLDLHHPAIVVVNAGGARFDRGEPVTMTAADVAKTQRAAPFARIVACHLEAINHCIETREQLREGLASAGLDGHVLIPHDGEALEI